MENQSWDEKVMDVAGNGGAAVARSGPLQLSVQRRGSEGT